MISVKFDQAALDRQLEGMAEAIKGAIRPAAAAAAVVYYDEVKQRATGIVDTGTLAASIYWKFVPELSGDGARSRYHVSWRKGGWKDKSGLPAAPHGQLVEYGFKQRYASYTGSDGQWYTAVRPEMRGKPAPKRRASQAEKDAYYVLRKGGAIQHAPRSFLRSGYEAVKDKAVQAAINELHNRIAGSQV